ncbi:hypothetical protein M409DRAFT_57473 [Zasmidium cellare ATCC 36951]|uniref:Uncharacterized protein n=1 Tax=Zasmidium cellare ATCC 36951 TaxID=1080233 RepID=A0A6A6CCF1_ZASCE|nr:uncharacterized protein M409DRAFT_57473 [Zasmidium cellare ATCC 36951]KAF2163592.1 hypothetical protein M409DRAFT_57473 [Zasmidium cellare ATCC 36951]
MSLSKPSPDSLSTLSGPHTIHQTIPSLVPIDNTQHTNTTPNPKTLHPHSSILNSSSSDLPTKPPLHPHPHPKNQTMARPYRPTHKRPKKLTKRTIKFYMDDTNALNPLCLISSLLIFSTFFLTLLDLLLNLLPCAINLLWLGLNILCTYPPFIFLLNLLATLITLYLIDITLWYTTALSTYPLWRHAALPATQRLSHWSVFRVYAVYAAVCFALLYVWTGELGWIGREWGVVWGVGRIVTFEGVVGVSVWVVRELGDG